MELSVIIPMYKESDRMDQGLRPILQYLHGRGSPAEVILVDDGSPDDTSTKAESLIKSFALPHARVIRLPVNRGKGAAVKAGMLSAQGAVRIFTDADNSTPADEMDRLVPMVKNDATIVIGSRGLHDSQIEVKQAWWRQTMGKTFNLFPTLLLGLPFKDTQCGFKAFGRRAAEICFSKQKIERFAFDVELLWIAKLEGLTVLEVPVRWKDVQKSRVHPMIDSCRMARDTLRIRCLHPAK